IAEAPAFADEAHPHAAPLQFLHFTFERVEEQFHQRAHLLLGTAPVFARESEQGQRADAALQAEIDAQVDRARAGAVADHARSLAARRPAAVAVHDDGDVARDRGWMRSRHGRKWPGPAQTAI